MTHDEIINAIKHKIQDENAYYKMDTIICNFLKTADETWDLRNIDLIGLGRIIKIFESVSESLPPQGLANPHLTYQVLILRNHTLKKYRCMMLSPTNFHTFDQNPYFTTGTPTFDVVDDGLTSNTNWIIKNEMEECMEISPNSLKSWVNFGSLLTDHQLRINDYCIRVLKSGKVPHLAKATCNVYLEENSLKNK